jgi:hypothetical protein
VEHGTLFKIGHAVGNRAINTSALPVHLLKLVARFLILVFFEFGEKKTKIHVSFLF